MWRAENGECVYIKMQCFDAQRDPRCQKVLQISIQMLDNNSACNLLCNRTGSGFVESWLSEVSDDCATCCAFVCVKVSGLVEPVKV